jgi:threonylcarbamoyladenosine tRNA methylthiotransferase MtaB
LEAVLREVDLPRLRITSLEPQDYDPTLLELWQRDRRLSRHFHLALQAGSDTTLVRMRRGYNLDRYTRIVEQIRRELPDASITTDVIVGFPGETDQEAAETLAFARRMGYAKMHVFPYSPRAGTLAATMAGQVPEPVKKARGEHLRLLSDELSQAGRQHFVGEERPVLWENN